MDTYGVGDGHKEFPVSMRGVRHVVMVMSGKGGVGKSTVAVSLAISLKQQGHKVGILDVDICGPSIPKMLNVLDRQVVQGNRGWIPVQPDGQDNFKVISIGFLLPKSDDPIVWRGPKKTGLINQFLTNVDWQHLDYLIIDTPPGTSDEHMCLTENLSNNSVGVVIVTTPQGLSTGDVRREITFCRKTGVRMVGLVENMSGFECPNCKKCTNIFSSGGGKQLAEMFSIPYLGSLPIDQKLSHCYDRGDNFFAEYPDSPTCSMMHEIRAKVEKNMSLAKGIDPPTTEY